jgi:hypothetical protein
MQKIRFTVFFFLFYSVGYSQFYKSVVPDPVFTDALEKVVLDFRFDFHTIQNDSIVSEENQSETYGSKVVLPGATDCEILRFHSDIDTSAAFQAIFYDGDSYDEALKSYRNCIRMIKRSRMKWIDRTTLTFSGEEKEPDPNLRFCVSTLYLNTDDQRYKYFCAEVEIVSDLFSWKVHLNLMNKRPDTEGPTN